jgi:phosphatidylserine/phosphatidylglycerophosphate/cardiolipin synthase-like enzyme
MHCHHEKIVVVDDEVAFVGGIDFTDLAGDRLDSRAHAPDRKLGWHDVATRLSGPIVADVAGYFAQRWCEVADELLPEPLVPAAVGTTSVRLVRTVPERTYRFAPHGEFTILQEYLHALRSAQSLIYLENQFLWSGEVVDVLVDKLLRPHVHAKVGVVDDAWLTIGSANLNEHSLFNDTEVNVVLRDPEQIRTTRLRLWSEHLQLPQNEISGDPATVIDTLWRPIATAQARLDRAGSPRTHRLVLLPGLSRRAERLQGPLRGLLVDG